MPYKDPEKYKEYQRQYYQNNKEGWNKPLTPEKREQVLIGRRQHYDENKETILARNKEYRDGKGHAVCREISRRSAKKYIKDYPERQRANKAVQYAIKTGKLTREPCSECGVSGKSKKGRAIVHAHHEDYSKPLDVIWLCLKCHDDHHKKTVKLKRRA
jgi:hypothetical protein